jgi:hypothetical protein
MLTQDSWWEVVIGAIDDSYSLQNMNLNHANCQGTGTIMARKNEPKQLEYGYSRNKFIIMLRLVKCSLFYCI